MFQKTIGAQSNRLSSILLRNIILSLFLISLLTLSACSEDDEVAPGTLESITVSPASGGIIVMESVQFTATGNYSNATTKDLTASATWTSSDTNLATVSAAGGVSGVAIGTVTITATDESDASISGTADVTVSEIISIAVTPTAPSIAAAATQQFTAEATTNDGTRNITTLALWTSSATAVATIGGSTGLATGVAAGTATITATSPYDVGMFGTATLTVTGGGGGGGGGSEGTAANPLAIASSALPHSGTVTALSSSYYLITGLGAATSYDVSLSSASGDVDLIVYTDLFTTFGCSSQTTATGDESCAAVANAAGELYIWVTGFSLLADGTFTLNATVSTGNVQEGTSTNPKDITGIVPYSGSVGTLVSYYKITSLTAGTNYAVSLTTLTDDAHLYVYSDSTFATFACLSANAGTTDESCNAAANSSGELYIQVLGNFTAAGATYTIDVAVTTGSVAEGSSANPVDLTGILPYAGQVDNLISYYKVTGLTASAIHTVTVTGMSDDVALYVYSASGFSTLECTSLETGTTDESCGATSNSSGELYIQVLGTGTANGATFSVDVAEASAGSLPDLTITIDSVTANIGAIIVLFTVANGGTVDSAITNAEFWPHRASAPTYGDSCTTDGFGFGCDLGVVTPVTAGGTYSGSVTLFDAATSGTAYIIVDSNQVVSESNEDNNVATFSW